MDLAAGLCEAGPGSGGVGDGPEQGLAGLLGAAERGKQFRALVRSVAFEDAGFALVAQLAGTGKVNYRLAGLQRDAPGSLLLCRGEAALDKFFPFGLFLRRGFRFQPGVRVLMG